MSNEGEKWACQLCTYENWPKTIKCTLCGTPRSSEVITAEANNDKYIYNKSSPLITNSSSTESFDLQLQPASTKWTCVTCTFLNWPRADRCTQCLTQRRSPPSSPNADIINNGRNRATALVCPSLKWHCPACTYENWPKSLKCVLCHTLRPKSELEDLKPTLQPLRDTTPPDTSSSLNNYLEEQRLRQARRKELAWLNACRAVVDGDHDPVIHYLSLGGDPSRQLNASEVSILGRPSAFDSGHTLVHLAIRFQRHDLLELLLSNTSHPIAKRVPSDVSRDLAAEIRRHIAVSLKQRKGEFTCSFVTEFLTFALPAEIEDLPSTVQQRLFDELLDKDVQKELEEESPIINWSLELTERLGSRLYALWNRSAGDCLLDSALQATWGVFDRDNVLRRALGNSLCEGAPVLYPRWKEAETLQANLLHFSLDETQWQEDWSTLLSLAAQPGAALEQMHIFTLAHILRRPIIVYGVKYVKSFRGEALGYARFEGIYLPLLWDPNFCWKSPISLGYTRGHFSALVPMEPMDAGDVHGAANLRPLDELQVVFLPLMTVDHQLLPVHFLTQSELGREEEIMHQWLDCCVTEGGLLVAQQKIPKRSLLVAQMVDEWMELYRGLACAPQSCSTSDDSDQEE